MLENNYKIFLLINEILSNKEVIHKNSIIYKEVMSINYVDRDVYFSIKKKYKYLIFGSYYEINLTESAELYYKNTKRSVKNITKLINKNIINMKDSLNSITKESMNSIISNIITFKLCSVEEYIFCRSILEGRVYLGTQVHTCHLSNYRHANEDVYIKILRIFDNTQNKQDLFYNLILFDALIENKVSFNEISNDYLWNTLDETMIKLDSVTDGDFKDCLSSKDKSLLTQLFADYDNNVINAGSAMFAVYSILVKSSLTTQDVEWAESELKTMKDKK